MHSEFAATLRNIVDQKSLRWIFVGGKGGVGKTTTACSIAVQLAIHREKVLIISTDPAHNLSDAFQQKVTSSPTQIANEVDPKPLKLELEGITKDEGSFLQDLAGAIPGIDEAMSFAEVMKLIQSLDYSAVVFDTAPTGHTLRLLQFPDTLEKGLGKLQSSSLGPLLNKVGSMMGGGGAGQSNLLGQMNELKETVSEVKRQFQNADLTTFVCVCIPEFLSLYETERLVQELAKQDIDVHNMVINQVIFKGPKDFSALLDARIRMQNKYLDQYDDLYGEDMHLIKMPLLSQEVRGMESLASFGKMLLEPYQPPGLPSGDPFARVEQLEAEVASLKVELAKAR